MSQYRQGDVWLERIESLPAGELQDVPVENGFVVLAHGEVTGHRHAIAGSPSVRLLSVPGQDDRFLEIGGDGASVVHEEHAPIPLPPGIYRVRRQREYSPEELRYVAD